MNASHEATKPRSHEGITLTAVCLVAAIAFVGCRPAEDLGPPTVAYGQAECELCKMIISEEPFAAAAVVATPDGVQKYAFDDIGCLLDFLGEPGRSGQIRSYVHDHATLAWLDASQTFFIRSETLHTPMGSHVAACNSPAAGEELLKRYPGASIRFEQLRAEVAERLASAATSNERTMP